MPRKILIADDNAINRQLLIKTLGKDYDVIEAENGKEALALMHRHYKMLSAVLLDIVMPEMDGYEVLRCVRDSVILAQLPILIITGSEDESSRIKALSLGANDFIIKPFNPEIIQHCLRNNIALRETASILNAIQKDKLTGLLNREAFFEKVTGMIRDREPGYYILSCFDIDNFKLINDQYGAVEGDRILREIGTEVQEFVGSVKGIAGRISADNFAALIPAGKKNTDVLQKLQERRFSDMERQSIVFSIGRYLITDLSLPASAIYDRAYIAKQSVKGRYDKHLAYFDEAMLEKLVRDQQIIGEMEAALRQNRFEVWFQPQYNHITGALIGAEALARWRHPEKGIVPPDAFVPLFEQNGFIYELDKYMWREVCRYMQKWKGEGRALLPVSVNVSRYDIFRADLIEVLTGLVEEYDIPIDLLRLEITESAFAKSTKMVVDIVKQLIDLGFIIEIDDFGSGYSSLNTLKNVPAQVVKLDMRFLEDDDDVQRGGNILESVVRMTKWLGMSVIAEGVETKAQGDFLKSIGCGHVQGFLYAPPMPAAEYEAHCAQARLEGCRLPLETVANLDNNMFWNPNSMDTLIFNSYVGAACIYECHNGNIEMLRATDKYIQMLGSTELTLEDLLRLDFMKYLDETSRKAVLKAVDDSARSKKDVTGELLFYDLPGCAHETYLRCTMRVIASTESRHLLYCISDNITAQRVSERKEQQMAKQLQVIMDHINCGITAVTIGKESVRYLIANNKYYELLGYTVEQYQQEIGNKPTGALHPEDQQRVLEIMRQTCVSGVPSSMEYRAVRRDGTVIWLRSLISMTSFDEVNEPVQLCIYADVTAQKQAAQELLDNLPDGAALFEYDNTTLSVVHLNKRYWQIVNRTPVTYTGTSVLTAIHPEDRAKVMEELADAIQNDRDAVCIARVRCGEEGYLSFRIVGRTVRKADGKYSVYASYTPISDEPSLIQEMLPVVLAAVMASSSDLSFVKDKNLRYLCCSRAFLHLVGVNSEQEVIGKTDFDLFQKEFAEQYVADDRMLMESGRSLVDMVEPIPSEDGKIRYSNTSKYLLYDSSGNVTGIYGLGRDVTQERETEAQHNFLLNSIPGGVAVFEGEWNEQNKAAQITYYSDGLYRLLGYTREEYEALGQEDPISRVAEEYKPELMMQIDALVQDGTPIDFVYRIRGKNDAYRWIHIKAVLGERSGDHLVVNAVLFDDTERQEAQELLRISEEESRLAIQHSKTVVCRLNIASRFLTVPSGVDAIFEVPAVIEDIPYGPVREGRISPETADAYIAFYESIYQGAQGCTLTYQRKSTRGWRWVEACASTIFANDGKPVSAVISLVDATESFEKDTAYKKWVQSLRNKEPDSYALYRCKISQKTRLDAVEGTLLDIRFKPEPFLFNERTAEYVSRYVLPEDAEAFSAFLNVETLLERYRQKECNLSLDYREKLKKDGYRWLRLTVDMVEYPHSRAVEGHLLFENIDEAKRAELLTIERAEMDALTGVFNRSTFADKVNSRIKASDAAAKHALLMLDIDGFKLVNDVFGHGTGDQTLIDTANLLRTVLRRDDLLGRLGGDEFLIFLSDIPNAEIASGKARQICELCRRTFNADVQISGSVGIAVCPQDGTDFETLYRKADETLYQVKDAGKDNYAFYQSQNHQVPLQLVQEQMEPIGDGKKEKKRRILIVDDSKVDYEMLAHMLKNDYAVEKAKDGNAALAKLRHFGSEISVILLDLMMPGMDGFAVLEKIQQSAELRSIPVIVVSGDETRETSLKAIRAGATDFVIKPVDQEVLRIRIQSAINKAENERLRVKNSFLELQSDETARYRLVLDSIGLTVVELNWVTGAFSYDPAISERLAGRYNGRTLWHIFLSDQVTDAQTVKTLQQLVHDIAEDRNRKDGSVTVQLKAASGGKQWFRVHIYKHVNEYGLADKLIITFSDIGAEHQS